MAASVSIELDVTPPEVVLDDPRRLADNRAAIPYVISADGAVVDASIDGLDAQILLDAIVSSEAYPEAKLLDVSLEAVDDVGNTRVLTTTAWLAPSAWSGSGLNRIRVQIRPRVYGAKVKASPTQGAIRTSAGPTARLNIRPSRRIS